MAKDAPLPRPNWLLWASALLLVVTGCVARAPVAETPIPPGQGRIWVYRNWLPSESLNLANIEVNGVLFRVRRKRRRILPRRTGWSLSRIRAKLGTRPQHDPQHGHQCRCGSGSTGLHQDHRLNELGDQREPLQELSARRFLGLADPAAGSTGRNRSRPQRHLMVRQTLPSSD